MLWLMGVVVKCRGGPLRGILGGQRGGMCWRERLGETEWGFWETLEFHYFDDSERKTCNFPSLHEEFHIENALS